MDLGLFIEPESPSALRASYACPCGCHPAVRYEQGANSANDTCCCGNEFSVGMGAHELTRRPGFDTKIEPFEAPWGDTLSAVWAIGPSTHASEAVHDHDGHQAVEGSVSNEPTGDAIDPVCGMTVDRDTALARGLHIADRGSDRFFCGKGCQLEFEDDPGHYLDPEYVPSM
jgi:YHS domain-containing protein